LQKNKEKEKDVTLLMFWYSALAYSYRISIFE